MDLQQLKEAHDMIAQEINIKPEIGMILGSGLGELADQITDKTIIPYDQIPHFPVSTVAGHAGQFVIGKLAGKEVIAMQGRFHYYEGYSMQQVVSPVYVMKQLGISTLVVTNAAGGMNSAFQPGDMMMITDHINFTGNNPLIGSNADEFGVRFPDMSRAYDVGFRQLFKKAAEQVERETGETLRLQEGVYSGISGPAYMTPSELKMLALCGADAVGMSTVPEVIAANHCGIKVLGVSCITDMAIGEELEPLSHEQVVKVANETKPKFIQLIKQWVKDV